MLRQATQNLITALYPRLSHEDELQGESNSISNQELLCRGWFLPPNTYDCGSFVVNGTAVVGKEAKSLITAANQHKKELIYMKSIFEQMGGTYRQEGDYLIPNLALPEEPEYQIGKYGRMRRSYLKEHRPVLYANLLTSGTLHRHLAEIDQACNERMEIIVSDMARQEDVTEALKAADQME
nr:TnpV protein [Flavonifractor plautii]